MTDDLSAMPRLLKPIEVAAMFGVSSKTVKRWVQTGKLPCIRTPGGHRRYRQSDVEELLRQCSEEPQ